MRPNKSLKQSLQFREKVFDLKNSYSSSTNTNRSQDPPHLKEDNIHSKSHQQQDGIQSEQASEPQGQHVSLPPTHSSTCRACDTSNHSTAPKNTVHCSSNLFNPIQLTTTTTNAITTPTATKPAAAAAVTNKRSIDCIATAASAQYNSIFIQSKCARKSASNCYVYDVEWRDAGQF